jgi:hypothetical protein
MPAIVEEQEIYRHRADSSGLSFCTLSILPLIKTELACNTDDFGSHVCKTALIV